MKKKAIILGIESSCDETAVALIEENADGVPSILSNIVYVLQKLIEAGMDNLI